MQLESIAAVASLALAFASSAAAAVEVHSDLAGLRIAATTVLPAPPTRAALESDGFCSNVQIEPRTVAGRRAAALGWAVTSEEERAGYTAVGMFSRGGNGTSGTCLIADGNVVLYRQDKPVAIVYEPPRQDGAAGSIGGVVGTLLADRLRISDFTPAGFESADLLLAPGKVSVVEIAALKTACGSIGLPNLRGMTVPQARKALAPHGWTAAVFKDDPDAGAFDSAKAKRDAGQTEFETCSGTGYGFCSVQYTHGSGAELHLTTFGDDSTVANYGVRCPQ